MKENKRLIGLLVMLLGLSFAISARYVSGAILPEEGKPEDKEFGAMPEEIKLIQGPEGELIERAKAKAPEYAPGELIVKLKEGGTLQDIEELNAKYKVSSTEKVFKDTPNPQETLKQLKDKLAKLGTTEHDKWYWQLDKNSKEYKEYVAKIDKEKEQLAQQIQAQEKLISHLEQRQKRAPEGVTPPNLENIYLLTTDKDTNIPQMATEYASNPSVEYAEPNYIATIQMVPNDPYYSSSNSWGQGYDDLWGLKKFQAEQAWDISQGEGVIVAVVDSGIDYNHEDIAQNIWTNPGEIPNNGIDDDGNSYIDDIRGWDFVGVNAYVPKQDNNPIDGLGHGTHVSGTIAALGNNNLGVIGVAPKAKVMAVKGLSDGGAGSSSVISDAIKYAVDNGADVINLSLGGYGFDTFNYITTYAQSKGCVVVAASGNDNFDAAYVTPANAPSVITVGASDTMDKRANFSNYGIKLDVTAPGGNSRDETYGTTYSYINILSLRANGTDMYSGGDMVVNNSYYRSRGTSMAAPHAAGVVALIISRNQALNKQNPAFYPLFNTEEIRQALRMSADDIETLGWDKNSGYGRINAYKALNVNSVLTVKITNPLQTYTSFDKNTLSINIQGTVSGSNFYRYRVEYGQGSEPTNWTQIGSISYIPVTNGDLTSPFDIGSLPMGTYTIRVIAEDKQARSFEDRVGIKIIPPQASGWPVTVGYTVTSPTFSDINNDGKKELVTTNNTGFLMCYSFDGKLLWQRGGDISKGGTGIAFSGTVSLADIDKSYPGEEVVVFSTDGPNKKSKVHIYHCDGTEITNDAWPKDITGLPYPIFDFPILADLDNDNGLEIIFSLNSGYYAYEPEYLYAFKFNGNPVSLEWPKKLNATGDYYGGAVAVGNTDTDSQLEIVTASRESLCVFNPDGSQALLLKPNIGYMDASAVILADIDNDRLDEIIIFVYGRGLYAFNGDGSIVIGWPYILSYYNIGFPSVADIDNDGNAEIMLCSDVGFYVINHDGTLAWKVDFWFPVYFNPVIGDIDGDNDLEIVFGSLFSPSLFGFHHNGKPIDSLTFPLKDEFMCFSSPVLADIDADNGLEMIISPFSGKIYVFENIGTANGSPITPWSMFQNNAQHTGRFKVANYWPVLSSIGNKTIDEGKFLSFGISATDLDKDSLLYEAWEYREDYDLNADGNLDYRELLALSKYFGQAVDPNNPESVRCDLKKDGVIDIFDLATLAQNYGHLPEGASFDKATQTISWIPTYEQAGNYKISFSVWDIDGSGNRKGGVDAETITIAVNNVDITPPTGTILINNNATYTKSTSVTLNLSATDTGGSGLDKMSFSNDNLIWSAPQAYATSKTWTLASGNGTKTVYAKFFDKAGNKSGNYSDTIILDTTLPTITNISDSPDPFFPNKGQVSTIKYTLGDNLSTKLTVYAYIYTSGGTLVRTLGPYTQNLGANSVTWNGKNSSGAYVANATYKYRIKATDSAGNYIYSGYYYVTKK